MVLVVSTQEHKADILLKNSRVEY